MTSARRCPTPRGPHRFSRGVTAPLNPGNLFLNRTTSLKISDWLDTLALDPGTPYPVSPDTSSDVSVFFTPEPVTVLGLALGCLALRRRRR